MKPTVLETPFAADTEEGVASNLTFARKCMHDMLLKGEAPYASHLLYTQPNVLDDLIPEERSLGIYAGFAWKHMEGVGTVFYVDRGISGGMQLAINYCEEHNLPYEMRTLEKS